MIKNSGKMLLALASVAVMAGCASPVKLDKPVEVEKKDVTTSTTTTQPSGQSSVATQDLSGKPAIPVTLDRVIYFAGGTALQGPPQEVICDPEVERAYLG